MRKFAVDGFRRWIPRAHPSGGGRSRKPHGGRDVAPEKVTRLLHQARKLASTLRHANQGYITPLENILRMTYGRKGPRKYELLADFLHPVSSASEGEVRHSKVTNAQDIADGGQPLAGAISPTGSDPALDEIRRDDADEQSTGISTGEHTLYPSLQPTVAKTGGTTSVSAAPAAAPVPPEKRDPPREKWKLELPPRLLALVTSQASEQVYFTRVGAHLKAKARFNPPKTTIWGQPLPQSRYKNLRVKWYNHNIKAAMPPLPEDEYRELHDLVSGRREMEPFIPRRTPAQISPEDMAQSALDSSSRLILEGPRPGPRLTDWRHGRPHEITPRLLRRLLSRVILKQTPFVKITTPGTKAAANSGLVFYWDDGMSRLEMEKSEQKMSESLKERQARLLFGS
ncbi:hypothetical protein AYL99_10720 [Fonsecaea erecta]|uniref:LYR motif-containing protein Cup1-like N-terminal domain-containing protein n=1 Tax=Fonsecaea erecta TaxID=1367422 RepID=A0A178Z5H6_9EURO|nr:hypothetical protein AYL99_10720 [Fonsecaea erecta]OAP55020.1 hypothetical protein AYL99_10720 [Fonsecaea erecta]